MGPLMKIKKPENLKIKLDQEKNQISIQYQDENSLYQSTRSLPKYISDEKLHREIKCHILNGQVKMILPKKPDVKEVENEKPVMIEVAPEIVDATTEDKEKSSEKQIEPDEATSSQEDAEIIEVEVVKE